MALGLLGARGERHVHRRRSACDWAAFLWGLAETQVGAGEGKGLGRRRLWCGWFWRPEEEEMTDWEYVPSPIQLYSCGSGGKAPRRDTPYGVWRLLAEVVWRPVWLFAYLLEKYTYVMWQVLNVKIWVNCEPVGAAGLLSHNGRSINYFLKKRKSFSEPNKK